MKDTCFTLDNTISKVNEISKKLRELSDTAYKDSPTLSRELYELGSCVQDLGVFIVLRDKYSNENKA